MSQVRKNPKPAITAYKGFSRDWKCRDFQFEVGKTYMHDGDVKVCESGFHGCEYPLDVFGYYAPATSVFAVVEQSGKLARHNSDSKIASQKLTVKAQIDLPGLIKAAVEYTFSRSKPIDPESPASATGDRGAASATGYQGAASATSYQGAASATGYQGAASATGDRGAASATGVQGAASATGKNAVACGLGYEPRAMAGKTGAICLVERATDGSILHICASKVGENGIKPDTWYVLTDGKFAEAK